MSRVLVILVILLCVIPSAAAGEYKIPPEAARQANPVKPTPQNMQRARKLFGYDCAMCHGKNGFHHEKAAAH